LSLWTPVAKPLFGLLVRKVRRPPDIPVSIHQVTPLADTGYRCSIEISMLAVVIDIFSIPVAVPTLSSDVLGSA
jgi:hypothetical protein